MKKIIWSTIGIVIFTLFTSGAVFAQGMPAPYRSEASGAGIGNTITGSDGHTAREEAEGKTVWEKLQAKQVQCSDLSDENFGTLGEYFMGQMTGTSHEAMNNMMIQMMGADGEKQMHIVMGKRMSGCEPNVPMPQNMMNSGMMSMMMNMLAPYGTVGSRSGMMGGGIMGGSNSMMGNFATNPIGWFGWGFGWIFMILLWGLVILVIVALIKWIMYSSKHILKSKSALDVLKERYAKGEIDKKEFKEKKKDLA